MGVHIHGFGAVTPAGSYGNGYIDAFSAEFVRTRSGFGNSSDSAVRNNDFYGFAVRIGEVFLEKFLCRKSHSHGLVFKAFAEFHRAAASVDCRSYSDYGHVTAVS